MILEFAKRPDHLSIGGTARADCDLLDNGGKSTLEVLLELGWGNLLERVGVVELARLEDQNPRVGATAQEYRMRSGCGYLGFKQPLGNRREE